MVTVPILDDSVDEDREFFNLALTSTDNAAMLNQVSFHHPNTLLFSTRTQAQCPASFPPQPYLLAISPRVTFSANSLFSSLVKS